MAIKVCPHCNVRYLVDKNTEDFEHECNSGSDVLDNEDVVVSGDWEDYTGSGDEKNVMMQGSENKLFATRADIEGEDLNDLTKRGANANTHRVRQHLQFIKEKGGVIK